MHLSAYLSASVNITVRKLAQKNKIVVAGEVLHAMLKVKDECDCICVEWEINAEPIRFEIDFFFLKTCFFRGFLLIILESQKLIKQRSQLLFYECVYVCLWEYCICVCLSLTHTHTHTTHIHSYIETMLAAQSAERRR